MHSEVTKKKRQYIVKEQSISSCTNMECQSRNKDLIPVNAANKLPTDRIKFLKIQSDCISLITHLEPNKCYIGITILKQYQIFIGQNLLHERYC